MKLIDKIKITESFTQLEAFLLDFEQYPSSFLAIKILKELKNVSINFRKFFQLRKINVIINDLIIMYSAAMSKDIILTIKDIELTIRIIDLLHNCCIIDYKNIDEISKNADSLITSFSDKIKFIIGKISLQKKTQYLSADILEPTIDSLNDINISLKSNSNFIHRTNNPTHFLKPIQKNQNDQFQEINVNNNSINIGNDFNIVEVSNLISMLKNTIDNVTASNTFSFTNQQLININSVARSIKNLASSNSINLIQATNEQIDKIDNFIIYLEHLSEINYEITNSNKNDNKTEILYKKININEIDKIIKDIINFHNFSLYDVLIEAKKNELTKLLINIEHSFELLKIEIKNTELENTIDNINNLFFNFKKELNNYDSLIMKKIIKTSLFTSEIYSQLSTFRSKSFLELVIGLQEYTNILTDSLNIEKIEIEIKNNDTDKLITANLWKILDNLIPSVIRNIAIFIFSDENKSNKIFLELISKSNVIELLFSDNAMKIERHKFANIFKNIILNVKNAGGKTFFYSTEKGNNIKFHFTQENILCNYIIVENSNQYYGISTDNFVQYNENIPENIPEFQLSSLIAGQTIVKEKSIQNYLFLTNTSKIIKLYVDNIVKVTMLSPKQLTDIKMKKYFIGTTEYCGKSVILLNIEYLMK